jgi:hypothetical protein
MSIIAAIRAQAFPASDHYIPALCTVFGEFSFIGSRVKPEAGWKISANNRRRRDIFKLSATDQELLGSLGYKKKIDDVDRAILDNAQFVAQVVENPEIFGHELEDERMAPETQADEKQNLGGSCVCLADNNRLRLSKAPRSVHTPLRIGMSPYGINIHMAAIVNSNSSRRKMTWTNSGVP